MQSDKNKRPDARAKAQAYQGASEGYFSDAINRHGIAGNSANLKSKYEQATKGLDPELAFKALDGGRVFGESDMARYNQMLAEKNNASQQSENPVSPDKMGVTTERMRMAGDAGDYLKQAMQKINQDNDITTTISGDNNTVTNKQDNSIRQKVYGGSSRTFNYTGGDGESKLYDTPVSKATMGGFYDVDDSPSAQAKFHDLHTGLNTDYQRAQDKYYKETGTFDYSSDKSRAFDPRKMMQRIDESPQRSYDMADKELANLYGDIWNFKMPNYEFGEPPKPIESPFDKGGDDDKDKDD